MSEIEPGKDEPAVNGSDVKGDKVVHALGAHEHAQRKNDDLQNGEADAAHDLLINWLDG